MAVQPKRGVSQCGATHTNEPAQSSGLSLLSRDKLLDFVLDLYEVISAHTLDLDTLLPALARLVRRVMNYQLFAVLLKEDKDPFLHARFAMGHGKALIEKRGLRLGEGITGAAAAQRKLVIVNDVRKEPRYVKAIDDVRSEMAVPLLARGRLVGVLDLESTRTNAFGKHERAILQLVATRIAEAIGNANRHRAAVSQSRKLQTLWTVAQEFASTLDVNELLTGVSSFIRRLIRYDAFSIFLLEMKSLNTISTCDTIGDFTLTTFLSRKEL